MPSGTRKEHDQVMVVMVVMVVLMLKDGGNYATIQPGTVPNRCTE